MSETPSPKQTEKRRDDSFHRSMAGIEYSLPPKKPLPPQPGPITESTAAEVLKQLQQLTNVPLTKKD